MLVIVTVEVLAEPAGIEREEGVAAIVKPLTTAVTIAVDCKLPLLPVIVTLYVPKFEEDVLMVRMEETLPSGGTFTKDGLIVTVGPRGRIVAVRSTRPEKRLYELIVMLEVAELPGRIGTLLGFGLREKAGGTPESLHAVRACNSQPERLCAGSVVRAESQKMKP
jgi:hypothetical protein